MATAENIFAKVWANKVAKEFILFVFSVFAAQFVLSASELLSLLKTTQDWTDLLTGVEGWLSAFSFAFVLTLFKQGIAWGLAHLGGSAL